MLLRQLFDPETCTYSYLLADEETREAVLIDPVREHVDRDAELIGELELRLTHVLETHVHADHVTGAGILRERLGTRTVVSEISQVECADMRARHGDTVSFGSHTLEVRSTPGHTAGDLTFVLDDDAAAFTGDTLLIRGCGRTDFQQGDPRTLYRSVHTQIFTLPDATPIYPGHDYRGMSMSTVGEEKRLNPRLGGDRSEDSFVEFMTALKLPYPRFIDESLPANQQCGRSHIDWAPIERSATGTPEVPVLWVHVEAGELPIIDVREPDELVGELGHIERAQNVPMGELQEAITTWSKETPVVIVCRSGRRSADAARALEAKGFAAVSMRGGMIAWNDAGYPRKGPTTRRVPGHASASTASSD